MTCRPFLLCLFTTSVESIRFASLVVTPWGYKASLITPTHPTSSCTISLCSSTSPLRLKKRKNRETNPKETRGGCFSLQGNSSSLLRFHGRVMLARVGDHTRAPAKSSKSGVYDSGIISYLSHSCGSCLPRPGGGVCHGVLGVLRVRIWCATSLIPPRVAVVLWLGAASSDSFEDPAYCGLHNPVRGLHRD
jgi:hypothetical protein